MSSIFPDHEVMKVEINYREKKKNKTLKTKQKKRKKKKSPQTSGSSTESNNILKDSYTLIKWSLSQGARSLQYIQNNQCDTQHFKNCRILSFQ